MMNSKDNLVFSEHDERTHRGRQHQLPALCGIRETMEMKKKTLLLMALFCLLSLCNPVFADYIHGYFGYTIADESVTITAYHGKENVVTVPAMIGSYPVNVIASGAFSNTDVTTIYLPDTIMSVEGGAFGPGQAVIYNSYSMTASGSGDSEQETDSYGTAGSEGTPATGPVGIRDDQGNLLTVDDQGNLVLVDTAGNETVLDDTQKYEANRDDQNHVSILNEEGGKVTVIEGSKVEFTDSEGRTVSTDTATGGRVITDPGSGTSFEEIEVELTEKAASTSYGHEKEENVGETEAITEKSIREENETESKPETETESLAETETQSETLKEAVTEAKSEPESSAETASKTTSSPAWPFMLGGLVFGLAVVLLMSTRSRRR